MTYARSDYSLQIVEHIIWASVSCPCEALIEAAQRNDLKGVANALESGAFVNVSPPVHYAMVL